MGCMLGWSVLKASKAQAISARRDGSGVRYRERGSAGLVGVGFQGIYKPVIGLVGRT